MSKYFYKILILEDKTNPKKLRYYFENVNPDLQNKVNGRIFGRNVLYDNEKKDWVCINNAHDAIVFCNWLNNEEASKDDYPKFSE